MPSVDGLVSATGARLDGRMADLTRNDQASRYESRDGDAVQGFAEYTVDDDVVTMFHTVVDERYQGLGIAGRMVGYALDDIRSQGKRVKPVCPYVASYLRKHPEHADMVAG